MVTWDLCGQYKDIDINLKISYIIEFRPNKTELNFFDGGNMERYNRVTFFLVLLGFVTLGFAQTPQSWVNITTAKPSYCVGEQPYLRITASGSLANKPIFWSYSRNGSTPIALGVHDQLSMGRGNTSFWEDFGQPLTEPGRITKLVMIVTKWAPFEFVPLEYVKSEVTFDVNACSIKAAEQPKAYLVTPSAVIKEAGGSEKIQLVADRAYLIDVGNGKFAPNMQSAHVNELNISALVVGSLYKNLTPDNSIVGGSVLTFRLGHEFLRPGRNILKMELLAPDKTKFEALAYINVLESANGVIYNPILNYLPSTQLSCVAMKSGNGYITFLAEGGDGGYTWNAPGGFPISGFGNYFTPYYFGTWGQKEATVYSGGQKATCKGEVYLSGTILPLI